MKSKNSMPDLQEIERYWIEKDKFEIKEMNHKSRKYCCWACARDTSNIEKCHIIAKSLGGTNEPSNLILLCSECHLESPDTSFEEIFWEWFYQKESFFSEIMRFSYTTTISLSEKYGYDYQLIQESLEFARKNSRDLFTSHPGRRRMDYVKDFGKVIDCLCKEKIKKKEQLSLFNVTRETT